MNRGYQGDVEGHPPKVDEDDLNKLDQLADDEGIQRLLKIPALE